MLDMGIKSNLELGTASACGACEDHQTFRWRQKLLLLYGSGLVPRLVKPSIWVIVGSFDVIVIKIVIMGVRSMGCGLWLRFRASCYARVPPNVGPWSASHPYSMIGITCSFWAMQARAETW